MATMTEFDDLVEQKGSAATSAAQASSVVVGSPIAASEVADLLSEARYKQISNNDDETVLQAIGRATTYVKSLLSRAGKALDLDDKPTRDIILVDAIYELHLALGSPETGKEYRVKAKDLFIAAFGDFPDSAKVTPGSPVAAITVPKRKAFP